MEKLKLRELVVKDDLADLLMKSWYTEDPFPGWTTKLHTNRPQFQQFLQQQYNLPNFNIVYKR